MSRRLLIAVPVLVVGGSYAWLAADTGRWAPWDVVVHEDGRRTLALTVFYPRHFLREVPVLLYYLAALTLSVPKSIRVPRQQPGWLPWSAAIAFVGAAVSVVVWQDGAGVAAADIGQYFRRDDEGAVGLHWGSHGLSNVMFLGVAWLVTSPWRPGFEAQHGRALLLAAAGLGSVFLVTSPLEAVCAPRAAGHQVRELLTHAVITLPLGLACLIPAGSVAPSAVVRRWIEEWPVALLILGVTLGLSALTLGGNALAAQPAPWSARLAAHVFEHAFDYVFVILVCLALRRSQQRSAA